MIISHQAKTINAWSIPLLSINNAINTIKTRLSKKIIFSICQRLYFFKQNMFISQALVELVLKSFRSTPYLNFFIILSSMSDFITKRIANTNQNSIDRRISQINATILE